MKLFYMQPERDGVLPLSTFLKDNYVGFQWPGIGDLEQVGREEWQEHAVQACLEEGKAWLDWLSEISFFVYGMEDGDYILLSDGNDVHLGDLGDYYYVENTGESEENYAHRRGVTWLRSLPKAELHTEILPLTAGEATLAKFDRAVSQEQMDKWTAKPVRDGNEASQLRHVDEATIEEALGILKEAMKSEDIDRRERAAIAILRFAK